MGMTRSLRTLLRPTGMAEMVRQQIEPRGISDTAVLEALRTVPRHLFVPEEERHRACGDHPLPIGQAQTISQPYVVAYMTEAAALKTGDRVLEIGTGSGYQAAVLAALGCQVHSMEILEPLARQADKLLADLGYPVQVLCGDGTTGWPGQAPFDAILVTAAPPRIPESLLLQLAVGGRMVIPVGEDLQVLTVVTRSGDRFHKQAVLPVRFVPMTGAVRETPGQQP